MWYKRVVTSKMSKKRLKNIFKRQLNFKLPSFLKEEKTILGTWGSEEIRRIQGLGQQIVLMKME